MNHKFGTKSIQRILKFLPIFDDPEFEFTRPDPDGGWDQWEAPELDQFVSELYNIDFLIQFDWPDWQDEAVRFYQEPDLIEQADLTTIRKLLTLHVRKDRFVDGHLSGMFEDRHIQNILRRLKVIYAESSSQE